jgi:membrane protein DedA with SNARE-associated domain
MEKSEKFFIKYGQKLNIYWTISSWSAPPHFNPAGISLMNLRDFILYTFIGSAIWNGILAALGYFLYTQQELLKQYYRDITIAVLILFVVFLIYLLTKIFNNKNNSPEDEGAI